MDNDAFEIFKNDKNTNEIEWIKQLLFIEYAEVYEVYDANTVKARLLVRSAEQDAYFIVRLLSTGSSKLKEEVVQPKEHDQVLLLFLRSHNDLMFLDPESRAEKNGGDSVVQDCMPNSYNVFSGVGILAATAKNRSPTMMHYGEDTDGSYIDYKTKARFMAAFKDTLSLVFDVPKPSASAEPGDARISVLFGRHSPLSIEHRAAVEAKLTEDSSFNAKFEDGAAVAVESADGAILTFDKAVSLKADQGITLDTGGDKHSIKNDAGSLKAGLDSTLTDCANLVAALKTYSSSASQSAITTGGASSASLAAAIVALLASLNTALTALGFSSDKTAIDNVLK
jgi:hypothetical protein